MPQTSLSKIEAKRLSLEQEADFYKRSYYDRHENCKNDDWHKGCEEIYRKWLQTLEDLTTLQKNS